MMYCSSILNLSFIRTSSTEHVLREYDDDGDSQNSSLDKTAQKVLTSLAHWNPEMTTLIYIKLVDEAEE